MIDRQEVEELLAACAPGSEAFVPAMDKMSRRKMRELCRAWLAVDQAPEADAFIASDGTHMWLEVFGLPADDMHASDSQRVQIVREPSK